MTARFVLVPDEISSDTVECLKMLLRQARKGEVTGIAFCAVLKRKAFIVNTAGTAHSDPTFTRGMMLALDDQLGAKVRGEQP